MEILLGILLVCLLFFSGPIALVWCIVLSSRLGRLQQEKQDLERQFGYLQNQLYTRPQQTPSTTAPPAQAPSAQKTESVKVSEESARHKAEQLASAFQPQALPEASTQQTLSKQVPKQPTSQSQTPSSYTPPAQTTPKTAESSVLPSETREPKLPPELKPESKWTKPAEPLHPTSVATTLNRPQSDTQWEKAHLPKVPKKGEFSWQSLELLIGRKILGWVAVVGFVLAATTFIRYVVQEGWIGAIPPIFKILGIAGFGGLFLAAGKYFSNIGWRRFSTMLSSAGTIIVFQAGYASFAFYKILSLQSAGVVMGLIVSGAFLLAWHYQSKLLGVIAILGGLAVPLLISSGTDRHPEFFVYLLILNLGAVMLVNLLGRAPIGWIAFFGTQAEFWLWHGEYYRPEIFWPVFWFQAAFYAIYLADTTIASMIPWRKTTWERTSKIVRLLTIRNQLDEDDRVDSQSAVSQAAVRQIEPNWDDALRAIFGPILFFGTIWLLLRSDLDFKPWLGIFAFIGAAWYALLATVYGRQIQRLWDRATDQSLSAYWKAGPTAATVVALGFVAIAIPLQLSAVWIALGWTVVFAGLWYFGFRQEDRTFRVLSWFFAALACCRLLNDIFATRVQPVYDSIGIASHALPIPLLNPDAFPSLVASIILIAIAVLTDRLLRWKTFKTWDGEQIRLINFTLGLVGFGFLTAILSVESVQYFKLRPDFYCLIKPIKVSMSAYWPSLSLTVLWTLLATVLFEVGIRFRSQNLRYTALIGLFSIAIKIFLRDFEWRLGFSEPLANPYCFGLILTSLIFIALMVRSRCSARLETKEKNPWIVIGVLGLITLLGILSIECYQIFKDHNQPLRNFLMQFVPVPLVSVDEKTSQQIALHSLTILWTLFGGLLILIGLGFRSLPIRVFGGLVLIAAFLKIGVFEILMRPDYSQVVANPYFLSIACLSVTAMLFAVWTTWLRPLEQRSEREFFKALGVLGVLFVWVILSVECFCWFDQNPFKVLGVESASPRDLATASLSILWTVLALILLCLGMSGRSIVLRSLGLLIFIATVGKIIGFELFSRPSYETAIVNPYFLSITIPVVAMILAAVWATRLRPVERDEERKTFLALGLSAVVLIWVAASVECFQYFDIRTDWPEHRFLASASLTVFWTVLGVALAMIATGFRSTALRILAVGMLALTLLKTLPFDVFIRPAYLTPFWNPYAVPLVFLAFALIFVCIGLITKLDENNRAERITYRVLAFIGVVFLWSVLSLECFRSVRLLQGAESEAWKAQMALSILWSVFAGVLIFVGFVWRSPILRWMAILLLTATLTKVLIVDMAGVHELYRFGAIFVLACVLTLAAWAYQRFRPEKIDSSAQ